ncbi:MAG TPA: ATP-binding protein [Propionibacteriaceae bacterium]|jgi:signal transduction histidine kinase|nr:ATP-binding protein [Propionibacteriaceae bacterium]
MITVADLRPLNLFEGLTDDQLEQLVASGTEVPVELGAVVFREGEPADFWWVLLDGSLDLVRRTGREDTVVARMDQPGRWAGGFRAWDEHGTYLATARARTPSRLLRIPGMALREWLTERLPLAGHLIEGLYRTARGVEATARQRSALVTLGTLSAGLAHEINNPAAAATRAVDALDRAWATVEPALGGLAGEGITADQFAALEQLRGELRRPPDDPDPLARADEEDALATWLSQQDVEDAWTLAGPLAAAGVDVDWCRRAAVVLPGQALAPAIAWVAAAASAPALLAEVKESVRRISELVAAVRSYSQMDRASMQQTDIAVGIDNTLVMLGHKLRDGVKVVRDYDPDLPIIPAYAGELNQVWTNLIDNAVDAMDGRGTLRVSTAQDGDQVVVRVADTGSGMPPEVVARAFDAFYTTKEVGKGTGLGLDIAKRIVVDRHRGDMAIESEPGKTVITVRLPRQRSDG